MTASRRGWGIVPNASDIPGSASAGYEYTSVAATNNTWLDSGGIPSNKTGVPFGLGNGVLDEIWAGNENLAGYTLEIYWHDGDEINLTLLTSVVVTNAARTATFDSGDFGVVNIPEDVQLAVRVVSVSNNPQNLKVYLRPTGDP